MSRMVGNTAAATMDYVVLIILNLVATPLLISNFGADGYGVFIFLSMFSIFTAMSFLDFGMEGSLMTYVARFEAGGEDDKIRRTLQITILYYVALGAILGVILYFLRDTIAGQAMKSTEALSAETVARSVQYISVNLVLQFLTVPFSAILQGLRRFIITKTVNSSMTAVQYILITAAAIIWHRIDIAFAIILGLTVCRLLIFIVIYRVKIPHYLPAGIDFDFSLLKQLTHYSSILFISRLIGLVFRQMDKLLIYLYLAVSSLTVFDVVSRPANLVRIILTVLNSAVIPEVARFHRLNEYENIRRLYCNLVRYAYLLLLPVLAVLGVHIADLLRLWVGGQFVQYAPLVYILLGVFLATPISSIASTVVVGMELVRRTIWISILASLINIGVSLWLLQLLGLPGLLWGTLVAELFMVVPYAIMIRRMLGFEWGGLLKPIGPIYLAAFAASGLHLGVSWVFTNSDPLLIVGIAVVTAGHLALNYFAFLQSEERAYLLNLVRRAGPGRRNQPRNGDATAPSTGPTSHPRN